MTQVVQPQSSFIEQSSKLRRRRTSVRVYKWQELSECSVRTCHNERRIRKAVSCPALKQSKKLLCQNLVFGSDSKVNRKSHSILFFKKMDQPRPLFRLFSVFSNKHYYIFYNNYLWKCPSSIRCRDSNPRPFEREPFPITTRPGLPPFNSYSKGYCKATVSCFLNF